MLKVGYTFTSGIVFLTAPKMSSQQAAIAQAEAHVDQLRVQANIERIQVSQASKEYVSCQSTHSLKSKFNCHKLFLGLTRELML